jgi:hypothetical protein
MKYIILIGSFILIACGSFRKSISNTGIMKDIYVSQEKYYNKTLGQNQDFKGLLTFSSYGRYELYKKNNVVLEEMDSCVILEGFNPGWGKFIGFLITESQIWFYTKKDSEWLFSEIDIASSDFEQNTGLPAKVIITIKGWDTNYINSLKKQIGNIVHDGYSFWAINVKNIRKNPSIINYTFYEYP